MAFFLFDALRSAGVSFFQAASGNWRLFPDVRHCLLLVCTRHLLFYMQQPEADLYALTINLLY